MTLRYKPKRTFRDKKGLTLIEVMIASVVLMFVFFSSMTALQTGFAMIDFARNTNMATQVLQSRMEAVRSMHWVDIQTLPTTWTSWTNVNTLEEFSSIKGDYTYRYRAVQLSSDLINVYMQVRYYGINNVEHTKAFMNTYAKEGLSDYYYTN